MKNAIKNVIITRVKEKNKKLICVVGATASGKTGLGVSLAKKFNGEIVSADSRQIFCGLDIGTGKEGQPAQSAVNLKFNISKSQFLTKTQKINPKKHIKIIENCSIDNSLKIENCKIENLKRHCRFIDGVPQWLIDICEPEQDFSMFDWLASAKVVLDDIWSRGKIPIVVGGTGLYVQALIEGFEITQKSKIKNQDDSLELNKYNRKELDLLDLSELQKIAQKLAASSYKLEAVDNNNPRRLIRFIEREQSGEMPIKRKPDFDYILIGIDLPREELYAKIDRRVEEWFEQGFYGEVEGLLNSGVNLDWLNRIGLEYRILGNYIKNQKLVPSKSEGSKIKKKGPCSFIEMKQEMKWKIHQYARRQIIWWRRFDVVWANGKDGANKICAKFIVDK